MTSKMSSKWLIFGSCLLFFASGCIMYALVVTRHLFDDEFDTSADGTAIYDDTLNSKIQNESIQKDHSEAEGGGDQPKGTEGQSDQKETEQKVLLLEQSKPNENEVTSTDPRVHYERTPDGRMKATMDITLHYQRQGIVSQRNGKE